MAQWLKPLTFVSDKRIVLNPLDGIFPVEVMTKTSTARDAAHS
jgi:hypothetical protein